MAAILDVIVRPAIAKFQRGLEGKKRALLDLRKPNARASVFLDKFVQENFREEGDKVGGWQGFADSTLERIAKYDPGREPAKLLQNSGRLRISFKPFYTADDAGIGSRIPYAEFHQDGNDRLPQRRMLPEREEVDDDLRQIYDDHVQESLNK